MYDYVCNMYVHISLVIFLYLIIKLYVPLCQPNLSNNFSFFSFLLFIQCALYQDSSLRFSESICLAQSHLFFSSSLKDWSRGNIQDFHGQAGVACLNLPDKLY